MAVVGAGLEDGGVVYCDFEWDGGGLGVELEEDGCQWWDGNGDGRGRQAYEGWSHSGKFDDLTEVFCVLSDFYCYSSMQEIDIPDPLIKPVLNGLAEVSKRAGVLPAGILPSNWIAQVAAVPLVGSVVLDPTGPVAGIVSLMKGGGESGSSQGIAEQAVAAAANKKRVWVNMVLVQKCTENRMNE